MNRSPEDHARAIVLALMRENVPDSDGEPVMFARDIAGREAVLCDFGVLQVESAAPGWFKVYALGDVVMSASPCGIDHLMPGPWIEALRSICSMLDERGGGTCPI